MESTYELRVKIYCKDFSKNMSLTLTEIYVVAFQNPNAPSPLKGLQRFQRILLS